MSGFALINKPFLQQLHLHSTVSRDFLPVGDFADLKSLDSLNPGISCQPVGAPHWRCHPNTNDLLVKPSDVKGAANITHALTHTSLGKLRTPKRDPVTRSALLGQSKHGAGCHPVTHCTVPHHLRLHWPFHLVPILHEKEKEKVFLFFFLQTSQRLVRLLPHP